jgi:hypothetical protein
MTGFKTRASASKHALTIGVAAAILASAEPTIWTVPNRTDNASVTGHQGVLVNQPGCWTENGYEREVPCAVVPGDPGL